MRFSRLLDRMIEVSMTPSCVTTRTRTNRTGSTRRLLIIHHGPGADCRVKSGRATISLPGWNTTSARRHKVLDRIREIAELNERSRKAHLAIIRELIDLMSSDVQVVTSADLKAIGLDDTPPDNSDYECDY
jgi:hypothetical protein